MVRSRIWLLHVLLFQVTVCPAAAQENRDGLLPPAGLVRGAPGVLIRRALEANDLVLAEKHVAELAIRAPGSFEVYFWYGFIRLRQASYHDAIRMLRRAEAIDPDQSVLKLLAVSYYGAHQHRLFLLKMEAAQQKDPQDFAPYYYLGRYYDSELADFARAARYFRMAIARRPEHSRSHYYLGYCYEVDQKAELAEAQYRRALELAERQNAPEDLPYLGMARLHLSAGRPSEALAMAKRAVDRAPRERAGHKLMARAHADLGFNVEAAAEWKISAELGPTDASTRYRLYRSYVALGEIEKARAALADYQTIARLYGTN